MQPDTKGLIDTLIHEELEARIVVRSRISHKYDKLNSANNLNRHKYINSVINRFFRLKRWNYENMG